MYLLSNASFFHYLAASGIATDPTELLDQAQRGLLAIGDLVPMLEDIKPHLKLEIAQFHERAADLELARHRVAREHRELEEADAVLMLQPPAPARACGHLIMSLRSYAMAGRKNSPAYDRTHARLAELVVEVPADLFSSDLSFALREEEACEGQPAEEE